MLSGHYIHAMERLIDTDLTMKSRYCREALIQYLAMDVKGLPSDFPGETELKVRFSTLKSD